MSSGKWRKRFWDTTQYLAACHGSALELVYVEIRLTHLMYSSENSWLASLACDRILLLLLLVIE